jgi:hypothetical protein
MATLLTTGAGNSVNILTSGSTSVLIATTAASNPGTPNTVTTAGVNTTGANLIVVMAGYDAGFSGTSSAIPVVTDNMGNGSYTGLPRQNSALGNAGNLFYFANPTVGSGHTFTLTGTNTFPAIAVAAFSNASSSPFDSQIGAGDAGSPSVNPVGGSVTPSSNNALIVTGCTYGAATATDATNISGSFAIASHVAANVGIAYGCGLAWWKQPTSSATNPQWTISLIDHWTCENAVFSGT